MSEVTLISSLYGLSKPDADAMRKHKQKVAKIIESMGEKYLLAKPIPHKNPSAK